jgi:hypothetical protein
VKKLSRACSPSLPMSMPAACCAVIAAAPVHLGQCLRARKAARMGRQDAVFAGAHGSDHALTAGVVASD